MTTAESVCVRDAIWNLEHGYIPAALGGLRELLRKHGRTDVFSVPMMKREDGLR
jgi:hypothetical protein